MYDRTVTRQQKEILSTANKSHAIVASLFPSNVRDKLLNQDMSQVVGADPNMIGKNGTTSNYSKIMGPPIADLYPNTTVLFCDVVDFTKWSSGEFIFPNLSHIL